MSLLLDPNVAYLLLVLTIFFATAAILVPGTGALEVLTLTLGVLAGYAMLHQDLNAGALVALVAALGALVAALFLHRHRGIWLSLSAVGFIGGSLFLFRVPGQVIAVHPVLALTVSLLLGLYFWFGVRKGIEAWRDQPPIHAPERLIGQIGEARTAIHHEGSVYVDGELWSARSAIPIPAGTRVRVINREGLILVVEPLPPPQRNVTSGET